MRSDYGLYVIAIICFAIAGALAAANIPGYTLSEASGITVVMIFLLIGIISAAVGYSTKPKEMMPITQPAPTTPMREEEMPIATQQASEEIQPPPPAPIEPMTTAPAEEEHKQELEAQVTVTSEPSSPSPATATLEAPQPEAEQPAMPAEAEKPKTTRRRRKKAQ